MIDGETACGGHGHAACSRAAPPRAPAPTRTRSSARVREAREALRIWFCLDTLEYLRRGGRIGKAQAWLGGTLKIKPILSLEYEIVPVERVRTAGRAFERMVQYAAGAPRQRLRRLGRAAHPGARAGQRLVERCREIFDSEPLFISEVGPVIGTYTGPGPDRRRRRAARAAELSRLARAAAPAAQHARADQQRRRPRRPTDDFAAVALDVAAPVGEARRPRRAGARPRRPAPCGCSRSSRGSPRPSAGRPSALASGARGDRRGGALGDGRLRRAARRAAARSSCRGSCAPPRSPCRAPGGAPRLTTLAAIRPAITPSTTRITAIAKKPQK